MVPLADRLFFIRRFRSGHLLIHWAQRIDAHNLRKRDGALRWCLFVA
jgi:hypothetical protein